MGLNLASVFNGVTTQNGGSNGSVNGGTNGNGGQNDHGHGKVDFLPSNWQHRSGGTLPLHVNGGIGGLNSYNGGFGGGGAWCRFATGGGGGYSWCINQATTEPAVAEVVPTIRERTN